MQEQHFHQKMWVIMDYNLYTSARLVADNSKSTQARQEAVHITITKSFKARTKHAYIDIDTDINISVVTETILYTKL